MATRLTDDFVRKFKPPKTGQHLEFDELVSGFGVRFTPTVTSFVIQWRTKDGRKPRETLGGSRRFPRITVTEARDLARQRLGEVLGAESHGGDASLRLAIRAWFARQAALPPSAEKSWRPRYAAKVDSIIRSYIEGDPTPRTYLTPAAVKAVDELGGKAVRQVTRDDVMAVVKAIKPGIGEQFMAIGSSFYNQIYEEGIETPNPFRNRLKVTGGRRVRKRKLTDHELLSLWRGFEKEGDPEFAAFQMLVLTGARRKEVTGMRWPELDLEAATWTLPAERRKTGKKDPEPFVLALHPLAVAIIKRQPIIEDNPFVFWGRRDKRPFDFQHSLMDRLRETVKVEDWRLHDIRRVVRSGMAKLKVSQAVAELCLGHKVGGLVGVYDQHDYADEKADAWRRWGDRVCEATGARP
jgi:integrase